MNILQALKGFSDHGQTGRPGQLLELGQGVQQPARAVGVGDSAGGPLDADQEGRFGLAGGVGDRLFRHRE